MLPRLRETWIDLNGSLVFMPPLVTFFMLLACIINNILAIALPSLRTSSLFRIVSIVLFYIAVIAIYTVYIQSIGSDMVIFSKLFNLSLVPIKLKRLTIAERKA